jgi:hypothetical protein
MNKLTTFSSEKGIDINDSEVMKSLQIYLDDTKIKKGFFEILNGGWQKQHEMTLPFDVDAKRIIHKLGRVLGGEVELTIDDNTLKFKHANENEGNETVVLHDVAEYDLVKKKVWR